MSTLETNLVQPSTGTTLTLGASGDTVTIPSGATITNSGTATGFGKVLQVVSATLDTETRTTSTTFVTSGLTATLTPTSTSNKVLILCNGGTMVTGGWSESTTTALYSSIGGATAAEIDVFEHIVFGTSATGEGGSHSISYLYSPSTTSSVAITPYFKGGGANQYFTNAGFTVSLILMEVAG